MPTSKQAGDGKDDADNDVKLLGQGYQAAQLYTEVSEHSASDRRQPLDIASLPQSPPKDRDSLDSILDCWLVHDEDCDASLYDGECNCIQASVKINLSTAIEAWHRHLSTKEMLELIGPDGEHSEYCDLKKYWDNHEDLQCSCDKEPQDRLREELRAALTREENHE